METIIIENENNLNIQFKARWARTLWRRFIGLLTTPVLEKDEGLLLSPCSSIHTIGMRYDLDLVFMDRDGRVIKCVTNLAPNRAASAKWAFHTLELPGGTLEKCGVKVGDRFTWSTD